MAVFIKAENISQAWILGCGAIMKQGFETRTNIKLHNLIIDIGCLDTDDSFNQLYAKYMNMEVFDRTLRIVCANERFGAHPSYWRRLTGKEGFGIDQISRVVSRLKKQPHSTKLTLQVYKPEDFQKNYTPCILCMELRVENQQLFMSVFTRSQDFGKKSYADYRGLSSILKGIGRKANISVGGMVVHTVSASISRRDLQSVTTLISKG